MKKTLVIQNLIDGTVALNALSEFQEVVNQDLGDLLSANKDLHKDLVSYQGTVDDNLQKLNRETETIGKNIESHQKSINELSEFKNNPTVNGDKISDLFSGLNSKNLAFEKQLGDYGRTQQQLAKKLQETPTEEEVNNIIGGLDLDERFNAIQNETGKIQQDLVSYQGTVDDNLQKLNRETEQHINKIKKDINLIDADVLQFGTMRNNRIVGGNGNKIRFEMRVTYGQKDVTQIASDHNCIRWKVNENDDSMALGRIFDLDGSVVLNNDDNVTVQGYLDKEHLLAVVASGYNVWVERNFKYRKNKFIPLQQGETCATTIRLYKDGIEIKDGFTVNYTVKGAGIKEVQITNVRDPYSKYIVRDGTPLIIEGTVTYNSQVVDFKAVIEQMGGVIYELRCTPELYMDGYDMKIDGEKPSVFTLYADGKAVENCSYSLNIGYESMVKDNDKNPLWNGRKAAWTGNYGDYNAYVYGNVDIPNVGSIFMIYHLRNVKNGGGKLVRPNYINLSKTLLADNERDLNQRNSGTLRIRMEDLPQGATHAILTMSINISNMREQDGRFRRFALLRTFNDSGTIEWNEHPFEEGENNVQLIAKLNRGETWLDYRTTDYGKGMMDYTINWAKLEFVMPGEAVEPTDFCLSIEDIAKSNTEMAKYYDGAFVRPNLVNQKDIAIKNNDRRKCKFISERYEKNPLFWHIKVGEKYYDTADYIAVSAYSDILNKEHKKLVVSYDVVATNIENLFDNLLGNDGKNKIKINYTGNRVSYVTNDDRPLSIYVYNDIKEGDYLIVGNFKYEEVKEGELELPTQFCLSKEENK